MTSTNRRSTLRAANFARPLALRARLRLQSLEERAVPATYTVNTTTDTASGTGTSGSLRYVIGLANGNAGSDSIVFDASVFASATTITLSLGELSITDGVTIAGPVAQATLAGSGSRILNINPATGGDSVTITNLDLTTGSATAGNGGAILNEDATLIMSGCTIANSTVSAGRGGGLYSNTGNVSLSDCTVAGNAATDATVGFGGGIFSGASLFLADCTVTDNTAAKSGGGVFADSAPTNDATISGSAISGNTAGASGGGVYFVGDYLGISDSTISSNQASLGNGGGVYTAATTTNIAEDCLLNQNKAKGDPQVPNTGSAGGVFAEGGDLSISDSTITANQADRSGGGVFAQFGTLAVAVSEISDNLYGLDVGGDGGGIAADRSATTIEDSLITGNTSEDSGLKAPDYGNGGGVFSYGADLTLGNSTITANRAGGTGSWGTGGGVTLNCELNFPYLLTVTECVIGGSGSSSNVSGAFGGGIAVSNGGVVIIDSEVINNESLSGGGIFLGGVTEAALSGDTITMNSGSEGGGVRIVGGKYLDVLECTISSNSATVGGGISVLNPNGSLTIDRTTINENESSADGAGIAFANSSDSVPLTIIDSTVSRNVAGGNGGGLHLVGSRSPRVQNSTIALNEAVWGGGVYFAGSDGDDEPEFYNATIAGNKAIGVPPEPPDPGLPALGGGIFLHAFTDSGDLLKLDSVILAKNDATSGSPAVTTGPDLYGDDSVNLANVLELFSIIGVADSAGFKFDSGSKGNNNGTLSSAKDPGLQTSGGSLVLTNNGGPTQTIALVQSSVAINKGRNPLSLSYDQRGSSYNRVVGKNADMGAYERVSKEDDEGGKFAFGGGGVDHGEPIPPAAVLEVTINEDYDAPGGADQRSAVVSVTVRFTAGVELPWDGHPESAFRLTRQSDGAKPSLIATDVSTDGDNSVVRLTFTGTTAMDGGSLADGRYNLTIFASKVSGGNFDGNRDGEARDDYVLVGDTNGPGLFRLYGDYTGDGAVDAFDFAVFRTIYAPGYDDDSAYDFGGDAWIGSAEYVAFAARYGTSI